MPSNALASEDPERVRNLGPDHRRWLVDDPIGDLVVDVMAVETHGQVHVLTHVTGGEASHRDHGRPLPNSEGSRDEWQSAHLRPGGSAGEEGAEVFQDLHAGNQLLRHAGFDQMTELDLAPVQWPDVPAYDDRSLAILHHPSHRTDQAVGIEDDIGVRAQRVWISGRIYPGVEGICPPRVLLVDDRDVDRAATPVDASHRSRRDVRAIGDADAFQMKGLDQRRERPVGGTVVCDHDLEPGVADDRHRPDRVHDSCFLVVRGDDDRDWRRGLTGEHLRYAPETIQMMHPAHDRSRTEPEPDHVELHEDEVGDRAVTHPAQDLEDHDTTWTPTPT